MPNMANHDYTVSFNCGGVFCHHRRSSSRRRRTVSGDPAALAIARRTVTT